MKESGVMLEIRKIRDENSLRHLTMSSEELTKEFDESVRMFVELINKDVEIVSKATINIITDN